MPVANCRERKSSAYCAVATSAALCAVLQTRDNWRRTAPYWLCLAVVWGLAGPVSENPRYYERGWHRLHALMHCAGAAGLTSLANLLLSEGCTP